MTHPELEELEALALGVLAEERAQEIEAHARECPQCLRELRWARAERELLQRRPAPPTAHLWEDVLRRISAARPRLHRPRWAFRVAAGVAGAAAAAAILLFALRPARVVSPLFLPDAGLAEAKRPRPALVDAKALAALDRAEADYRDAAKVLEGEYERLRPRLDPALARRWDETLTRARAQLGESRNVAAEDVNARMRLLDGYAGYLRSLRSVVIEAEEGTP